MTSESAIGDRSASTVTCDAWRGMAVRRGAERHAQDELTIRMFRALYRDFDLYTVGGTHVVVPKGTPWFSGASLGSIARQISEYEREEDGVP